MQRSPSDEHVIDADYVEQRQPGSSLRPQDILLIVYRRRWIILLFSILGFGAAAGLWYTTKPQYVSTAKVLVRYVVSSTAGEFMGEDDRIQSPDSRGESILSSEAEILLSADLAYSVARELLSTNLDSSRLYGSSEATLAGRVLGGLSAGAPRKSTILVVTYSDPEPAVVQPILQQVLDRYRERHQETYKPKGVVDLLFRRSQSLKTTLDQIETQLGNAKSAVNVVDFAQARLQTSEQIARLEEMLLDTEASLSEQKAKMNQLQGSVPTTASTTTETNVVAMVDPAVREGYQSAVTNLRSLQAQEQSLLLSFGQEYPLVQNVRRRIDEIQTRVDELERQHPGLRGSSTQAQSGGTQPSFDPIAENARLVSLQAKLTTLQEQLTRLKDRAGDLDRASAEILKLEAQRQETMADWKKALERYDHARAEAERDPSQQGNIQLVQSPSDPQLDNSPRVKKAGAAAGGGVALGLLIAFLLDLFIDQRIRTASEVEKRLHIPLLLTIPKLEHVGQFSLEPPEPERRAKPRALPAPVPILPSLMNDMPNAAAGGGNGTSGNDDETLPALRSPWDAHHAMRPYFDALRDRLTLFFQLRALKHKPKLVAVTGCSQGAGTSTIAAGLAAALSETGDGNVLLIDMNLGKGAVHPFFEGKPGTGLSDAFEPDKRIHGQLQENLYLASVDAGKAEHPRPLPKRLHSLMPKMRASDYDYIIFDMPPISQTSVTVALAANMDSVLLVAEGNKTLKPDLKRAHDLVKKYNPNVMGVFNKEQVTGPKWLLPNT